MAKKLLLIAIQGRIQVINMHGKMHETVITNRTPVFVLPGTICAGLQSQLAGGTLYYLIDTSEKRRIEEWNLTEHGTVNTRFKRQKNQIMCSEDASKGETEASSR